MLQNQLAKGNNGLVKTKYLTFSIEGGKRQVAKPRLKRIETDVINNFKRLGVACEPMDGKYACGCKVHDIFRMDEQEPFHFSWAIGSPGCLPRISSRRPLLSSRPAKPFCMGRTFGAVSFVQILAPELNDCMLADFLTWKAPWW